MQVRKFWRARVPQPPPLIPNTAPKHVRACTHTHSQTHTPNTYQKQGHIATQARTYKEEHDGNVDQESKTDEDMLIPRSLHCLGKKTHSQSPSYSKLIKFISSVTSREAYHFVDDKVAVDTHHNDSYNPDNHSHDTTIG